MRPIDFRKLLGDHPFFAGMTPEHLTTVSGCAANAHFPAGKQIFRQLEPADYFYVIREGQIAIDIESADRGIITIQTLGDGDVLGWSWLFPPYVWHFDARATTPTHAVAMDGRCLRAKCDSDPALGYDLMKRFSALVIARLQATRIQLMDIFAK
jgi:CRP/FNR family cyclic AMP-dependent transcriptional regulator